MSTKSLTPDQIQILNSQELAALKATWTLEELEELSRLFQGHSWLLFHRCLDKLTEQLDKEIWGSERMDVEKLYYLRGQMKIIQTINKLPQEIELATNRVKEAFEMEKVLHDTE